MRRAYRKGAKIAKLGLWEILSMALKYSVMLASRPFAAFAAFAAFAVKSFQTYGV